jgi:excisionase family DNA binding protein
MTRTSSADRPSTPSAPFEGRLGISIDETATALGVQRDTVYRLIGDGRLIVSKLGRRTIVHVASVQRLLAETVVISKPRVRRRRAAVSAGPDNPLERYSTGAGRRRLQRGVVSKA